MRATERGYSTVFYNIFVRQGADANQHALSLPYCPFIETNCDVSLSLLAIPTRAAAFFPAAIFFDVNLTISLRFFVCIQLCKRDRNKSSNLCQFVKDTYTHCLPNSHMSINIQYDDFESMFLSKLGASSALISIFGSHSIPRYSLRL